ncbi:MAG TPA: FAD-dependent oxidoreductase [Acidimicrobiales bacterium]
MTVSRRQFLIGLGAVGGAGAVLGGLAVIDRGSGDRRPFRAPAAGDFTLQGRTNETSVLVLGAGVAGLACAYELEKAGYAVTVLEARGRTGGRNLTVRPGTELTDTRGTIQRADLGEGRWFNAGPARIAAHHTTIDYCRELGVAIEPFVNVNVDAYVVANGEVRRRRSLDADLDGYIAELLTKAIPTGVLDDEITADEKDALYAYLRGVGAIAPVERGYDESPGAGEHAGEIQDPDQLAMVLAFDPGMRRYFERDWHLSTPMFHPVGGMDALPLALTDALVGEIHTAAEVRSVGADGGGVSARLVDGSEIRADHGICTLPPWIAAALASLWDPVVTQALQTPVRFATGKIGLEYDRRFWETGDRILGGITTTDREPREIWYPSSGYLGHGGVLIGAYPFGPAADRFSRLDHDARTEAALTAGEEVHGPEYREGLRSSLSVDWGTQPYSEGAWAEWPDYGVAYQRLLEPAGRWWFAGDWLTRTVGWQHGALESARRTVTALHEMVLGAD